MVLVLALADFRGKRPSDLFFRESRCHSKAAHVSLPSHALGCRGRRAKLAGGNSEL